MGRAEPKWTLRTGTRYKTLKLLGPAPTCCEWGEAYPEEIGVQPCPVLSGRFERF